MSVYSAGRAPFVIRGKTNRDPLGRGRFYTRFADSPQDFTAAVDIILDTPLYRGPRQWTLYFGFQSGPVGDDAVAADDTPAEAWLDMPPLGRLRQEFSGWQFAGERADFVEPDQETILRRQIDLPQLSRMAVQHEHFFAGFQATPLADDNLVAAALSVLDVPPVGRQTKYEFAGWQQDPLSDDNYESFTRTWVEVPAGRNPLHNPWDGSISTPLAADNDMSTSRVVYDNTPRGRVDKNFYDGAQLAPLSADVQPDVPLIGVEWPTQLFAHFRREPVFIFDGFTQEPLSDDFVPPVVTGGPPWRPTYRPRRR